MIAYTVRAEFDDEAVADEWIAWLRDEHLAEVLTGGAMDAEVVKLDRLREAASGPPPVVCEVRYHFASREAFDRYVRDHASGLREKGLAKFPSSRGVRYQRSVGEVVA